jgi:hypothetical protein
MPCAEKDTRRCLIVILALSTIDVDEGLRFLPSVVEGDMRYRGQREMETRKTREYGLIWSALDLLLSALGAGIVPRIACHLRELGEEEKHLASLAFTHALETAYVHERHARFTQIEKERILKEFRAGLTLTGCRVAGAQAAPPSEP